VRIGAVKIPRRMSQSGPVAATLVTSCAAFDVSGSGDCAEHNYVVDGSRASVAVQQLGSVSSKACPHYQFRVKATHCECAR